MGYVPCVMGHAGGVAHAHEREAVTVIATDANVRGKVEDVDMSKWFVGKLQAYLAVISLCALVAMIGGCKVEDKTWIDKMLLEMEDASIEAEKTIGGQEARDKAVNLVARKYFHPGMPKAEAFKLLGELKAQGFDIGEYRHEGARNWPDGEFKPYLDEGTRRNLQRQIPKEVSRFSTTKEYEKGFNFHVFFYTKHVGISFRIADGSGEISDVEVNIGATAL